MAQPSLDSHKLVFIDETGANTKMVRPYGRSPKGTRLLAQAPFGHWKTTTFTAGLRASGLVAPFIFDGPMTGEAFLVYLDEILIPTLEADDIVIMDNLLLTKLPVSENKSKPPAQNCSTFPLIRRISTQSK